MLGGCGRKTQTEPENKTHWLTLHSASGHRTIWKVLRLSHPQPRRSCAPGAEIISSKHHAQCPQQNNL
jgi:hypothetical protein